jgi:ferritin-like metal-binding protein YciE
MALADNISLRARNSEFAQGIDYMRAETQTQIENIKQSIELLRRFL